MAVSPMRPAGRSKIVKLTLRASSVAFSASHTWGAGASTLAVSVPSSPRRSYDDEAELFDPLLPTRSVERVTVCTGLFPVSGELGAQATAQSAEPIMALREARREKRMEIPLGVKAVISVQEFAYKFRRPLDHLRRSAYDDTLA